MSFKVYEGARLKGVRTLEELQTFSDNIKIKVTRKLKELTATEIKDAACIIYDSYYGMGHDALSISDPREPLTAAVSRIMDLHEQENKENNFSIGFASAKNYTLAIPFFPNPEATKVFFEHPKVVMFGYWNSSDPDPDVPEDEWELRKILWSQIFKDSGVPLDVLLMTRILDNQFIMPDDEHMVDQPLPSVERREKNLVQTFAYRKAEEELREEGKAPDWSALTTRVKELTDDVMPEVTGKLNAELTLDDLYEGLPELPKSE